MPRLPYQSEISAKSLRGSGAMINTRVNPDAYGASIGQATQESAQGMARAGQDVFDYAMQEKERKLKEDHANFMAQNDYTPRELEIRNTIGPDAKGYHDAVTSDYNNFIDEKTKDIQDDKLRQSLRMSMLAEAPNLSSRAAQYEAQLGAAHSKDQADASLNTLNNKIAIDPSQYDTFVKQGLDVIDARPNMTQALKEGMKQTFKYDSAKRRFQGMLDNAKTREDYNAIAAELAGKGGRDWSKEFMPEDFNSTINSLASKMNSYNTRVDSDAKAVMSSLEEQSKSLKLLSSQDLAIAQQTVGMSSDSGVRTRMGRLMRDQNQIRTEQALPPSELRARINAVNGNPGLTYPDLPPVVSDAVNEAGNKFGVSAGLLGAMAHREYGSEFKKQPVKVNDQFRPQGLSADVDIRNMRQDVLQSTTMAGEMLGAPLKLVKGSGNAAINVSTVGMSSEDKAKLAGALADAGFTGFSEKDGALRADMRDTVSKFFGIDKGNGVVWGGEGAIDPAIFKTLQEKGFAAGAASSTIKRSPKAQTSSIDYGKQTGILGPDGKPTSSAVGVFQFTTGTWKEMMQDPTVVAAMGVDLTGKSDSDILAMRTDPRLSTIAAAAYAAKNKKTLETALGRSVGDAEVYMAHFMGAGAALNFINAVKTNPQQDAAALLPETAKANKPVFYDKGKPRTVEQVYNAIAQDFSLAPSRVAFDDNQLREKMLKQTETALKEDPMTHALSVGSHTVIPLDQDGAFASRGATARAVADYYTIPLSDMKPFTQDETAWIKSQLDDTDPEKSIQIMAEVQSMGRDPAKAALKQLGAQDRAFAHAGDLYLEGSQSVATDIIRGRKMLQENPALKDQLTSGADVNAAFVAATGGALYNVDPAIRQGAQEAALAYYVRMSASQPGEAKFDDKKFGEAVQAIMGGRGQMPAIDTVNGEKTLLPAGVPADVMESALARMNLDDYIRLSATGDAPRLKDGAVVDPQDIKDEVMLRFIGGGHYKMMLDDGTILTTGKRRANGDFEPYLFKPDVEYIRSVVARPDMQVSFDRPSALGIYN